MHVGGGNRSIRRKTTQTGRAQSNTGATVLQVHEYLWTWRSQIRIMLLVLAGGAVKRRKGQLFFRSLAPPSLWHHTCHDRRQDLIGTIRWTPTYSLSCLSAKSGRNFWLYYCLIWHSEHCIRQKRCVVWTRHNNQSKDTAVLSSKFGPWMAAFFGSLKYFQIWNMCHHD